MSGIMRGYASHTRHMRQFPAGDLLRRSERESTWLREREILKIERVIKWIGQLATSRACGRPTIRDPVPTFPGVLKKKLMELNLFRAPRS